MVKTLLKCMTIAALWGAFQSIYFLSQNSQILFSDIVLTFGFFQVEFLLVYIIDLSIAFLPIFLFQIIFGTYIYQHFCTAGIYYFSRRNNRIRWFLKESVKLYVISFVYVLTMIGLTTGLSGFTNQVVFDKASIILFIYYLLIHSIWLYLTSLLMNIIAIKLDSSYGFITVVGLQMFFISSLLLWNGVWPIVNTDNLDKHVLLLKMNPISHLILTWHSSEISAVNERVNNFDINFSFETSVFALLFISIVITTIGCFVVKRKEWIELSGER